VGMTAPKPWMKSSMIFQNSQDKAAWKTSTIIQNFQDKVV